MNISFTLPLNYAWKRMTGALFKPFNINAWFAVGFCAFLASLTEGPFPFNMGGSQNLKHFSNRSDIPYHVQYWISENPLWVALIGLGILILLFLWILFIWLSSRGAFMFLDNVVHNRAEIKKPWGEFRTAGNSVFLWRLIYGLVCFIIIILFIIFFLAGFGLLYLTSLHNIPVSYLVVGGILFILIIITMMYISMFLNNFVIPIMYKQKVKVLAGWSILLKLFNNNSGNFIVYGLFLFLLHIATFIIVMIGGVLTCCIGFLLIIIPYINAVILLPISYTFRAYSIEFLKQFGSDYDVFPKEKTVTQPQ
jgi:hypothetical protein